MKKIVFITGSLADWGLLRPIVIDFSNDYDVTVVDIGSHVANQLESLTDTVSIVDLQFPDGEPETLCALYSATATFGNLIFDEPYDACIVLGDRIEMLAMACAARSANVAIHHLYSGDVSGCLDDYFRDSIMALADELYVVSQASYDRAVLFQKACHRVHIVNMVSPLPYDVDESFLPDQPYAVARFHPETLYDEPTAQWVREVAERAEAEDIALYFLSPNTDNGCEEIAETIDQVIRESVTKVKLLGPMMREQYFGLLKNAEWIAGNSSSFVLEAPFLNPHIILYGNRQQGRSMPCFDWPCMIETLKSRINRHA